MDDLLRYLPPAVALWVSDEIEWVSHHSVEVTIFLVLAWLLRSVSIIRGQYQAIAEELERLDQEIGSVRRIIERI
jgi:hypothetical protein